MEVYFRSYGKVGRAVALIVHLVRIAFGFSYSYWNRIHLMRREWADSPLCSVFPGAYFGDAIHRHVHSVLDTANPFPLPIPVRSVGLAEAEH